MKVIFLDIDGVLNHDNTRDRIGGFLGLNPEMIKRFNRIIEAHPDVKIVISSTWRYTYTHGVYVWSEGRSSKEGHRHAGEEAMIAIGPDFSEKIDAITGHLRLY